MTTRIDAGHEHLAIRHPRCDELGAVRGHGTAELISERGADLRVAQLTLGTGHEQLARERRSDENKDKNCRE